MCFGAAAISFHDQSVAQQHPVLAQRILHLFSMIVKCDFRAGTGDMNRAGNPILKMSLSRDDNRQHSLQGRPGQERMS